MAGDRIGPYLVQGQCGWGGFADAYRTRAADGTPLILKVAVERGGSRSRAGPPGMFPARGVGAITGSGYGYLTLDRAAVAEVFAAEAEALRAAAGHRLPRLIDELVTDDGLPVLVLELLSKPWPAESAPVGDFARILDACADLGPAGLRGHGDLKPEHVFLDAAAEFVFIDPSGTFDPFGTFRLLTPEYQLSPHLGPRSADVCAVAVMLYQRLTAQVPAFPRPPYPGWRAAELRARAQRGLRGVYQAGAGIAGWVDAVLGAVQAVDERMAAFYAGYSGRSNVLSPPDWFDDQAAAASLLRAAIAERAAGD